MTGLYIVLGVLVISVLLLVLAGVSSRWHGWKLRSPIYHVKPAARKRKGMSAKKKPIVQITFNKR